MTVAVRGILLVGLAVSCRIATAASPETCQGGTFRFVRPAPAVTGIGRDGSPYTARPESVILENEGTLFFLFKNEQGFLIGNSTVRVAGHSIAIDADPLVDFSGHQLATLTARLIPCDRLRGHFLIRAGRPIRFAARRTQQPPCRTDDPFRECPRETGCPPGDHCSWSCQCEASGGRPDPTFGRHGVATAALEPSSGSVDLVVQRDDKVVVAVDVQRDGQKGVELVRFTASGRLDRMFGKHGRAVSLLNDATFRVTTLALAEDGGILVGGGDLHGSILRYRPDGTFDEGFGMNGMATLEVFDGPPIAIGALMDGSIEAIDRSVTLARIDASGSPDPRFGSNGVVSFGSLGIRASAAAIGSDGAVLVAGEEVGGTMDPVVAHIRGDGSLDPHFGSNGIALITPLNAYHSVGPVAAIPSGGAVVWEQDGFATFQQSHLLLLDAGGALAQPPVFTLVEPSRMMVERVTNRILLAGVSFQRPGGPNPFPWATFSRFTPDLMPDPLFGHDGTASAVAHTIAAFGLGIDRAGRIVIGSASERTLLGDYGQFVVERRLP